MVSPVVETPLNNAAFGTDDVSVKELGFINKVVLRGDFANESTVAALDSLVSMDTRLAVNTFVGNADSTLYWMGPNERLLHTSTDPASIIDSWKSLQFTAAVDVSDYYTLLELAGPRAREVFSSGSPLDVHPTVFNAGQCAQTRFGNASVVIAMQNDSPQYMVQVRWSFAPYVYRYMERVASYV